MLTIGLPLVAGLSLQQLAGVLAHEFGHFSQGAGMRLTYIVRSINAWFLRVVYEPFYSSPQDEEFRKSVPFLPRLPLCCVETRRVRT